MKVCSCSICILQVPPVMCTLVVLGASGCQQICKFDAHTEDHLYTHIKYCQTQKS